MQPPSYMSSSVPIATDFIADDFFKFLQLIQHPPQFHRKLWEWAFILHHLTEGGKLSAGMKGLGFGVGQEKLPSIFASRGCEIVATDGTQEVAQDWSNGQYSDEKSQLFFDSIISKEDFDKRVSFEQCDMNNIAAHLTERFDFCWSACALEHLGSLDAGMTFIMKSLRTLKPGGIAVHTTELNLDSDDDTVSTGGTVLYRRKDIARLNATLSQAGHKVKPIPIAVGASALDSHVDVPPYSHNPHLKLQLMQYTSTSIGVVVQRGLAA